MSGLYLSLIISLALIYGFGRMKLETERKYKAFEENMANAGDMTKSVPRSHFH
jgi:hypothetical protein